MKTFSLEDKKDALKNHRLYEQMRSLKELRLFMENHVYAVLDFMSLTKRIQSYFAPTEGIWTAPKHPQLARFINEVVLAEESDELPNGDYLSHFDMYLIAMEEVGADTKPIREFTKCLERGELLEGLKNYCPQYPARNFTTQTYQQVFNWEIHQIVAAFCHGREKVIPLMFLSLAEKCGLKKSECPMFFYYLERHIELDGDEHGPLADKLLNAVVGENPEKLEQSFEAAELCLNQRIQFWDEVSEQLDEQRPLRSESL